MSFGQHLAYLRKRAKLSQQDVADHFGITKTSVSEWERDLTMPAVPRMVLLAELLRVDVTELINPPAYERIANPADAYVKPGRPYGKRSPISLTDNQEFPSIRRVAIKAQAGVTGYAIEYMNDDGPPIVFRKDWYSANNYKPEKMLALRVSGESMIPSLYAGDLIIINTAQSEPKDGIAFVIAYEGEIVVKRLVRDAGQWWLTSDNPDQRRYPRKSCDDATEIVGEVVYRQTERI